MRRHRKVIIKCDWCGREMDRYPCKIRPHNFCNRGCLAAYSNKQKNPEGYAKLKNYDGMSKHMTRLNEELNPSRMTFSVRSKLSMAHKGTGAGKTYAKSFGVHTHRMVAERILGRKLLPGEVVHHIDRNRRNNHPSNLIIFSSQAEHAKWHKEHEGGDAL